MKHWLKRAHCHLMVILVIMALGSPLVTGAEMEGPMVDAISFYNQAVDAAAQGSDSQAMMYINKALEIEPDLYLALITKAGLLSKQGDHTSAMELLDHAEKKHPDNPYILAARAFVFINDGKYLQARDAASRAVAIDPTLTEAWVIKGTAHGALEEYDEELNASMQALQYDPENAEARSNFDFAQDHLNQRLDDTPQTAAETTPFPGYIVLMAFLSCAYILKRKY